MAIPLTLSEVPDVTPYIQYVATSGQTVFPYPFPITQDSDLVVVVNGVTLPTDSGYSLSGQGNDTGGNLTFTAGQTVGAIVTLYRDVAIERITQFGQNSGFSSTAFNAEFNNIYLILQQLEASISQCLQVPNTNNPAPTTVLTPAEYANSYMTIDGNGNPQPGVLTSSGAITTALLAPFLNLQQTTQEATQGVTPTSLQWPPYNAFRYMTAAQIASVQSGLGTVDVTAALQTLFTLCAAYNQTAIMPPGIYKISSALTWEGSTAGGGILMTRGPGGGGVGDSQILVTGTGYTALTMYGVINNLRVCIGGSGNACNGLQLGISATSSQNVQQSCLQDIRVNNLAGFGVKICDMYDTWIGSCSVQLCGTSTLYAFSMNAVAGGTQCNMTTIDRLQVEQATDKAIYTSASDCLSCTFNLIHSERTVWDGTNPTHLLGGDSCVFKTMYLTSTTTALVLLNGFNCEYGCVRVASGNVELSNNTNVAQFANKVQQLTCNNLTVLSGNLFGWNIEDFEIGGTLTINTGPYGQLKFTEGNIANVAILGSGVWGIFEDVTITGSWTTSGNSGVECRNCTLSSFPTQAFVNLYHGSVTGSYTTTAGQVILSEDVAYSGSITMQSNGASWKGDGNQFGGGVTTGTGTPGWLFGPRDRITGGSAGGSINESPATFGSSVSYVLAEKTWNIAPGSTSVPYWVCTTAGAPGTWTAAPIL